MKTSKRHHERIVREEGCRAARRSLDARRQSTLAEPALRRLFPLG